MFESMIKFPFHPYPSLKRCQLDSDVVPNHGTTETKGTTETRGLSACMLLDLKKPNEKLAGFRISQRSQE